jgi:8-oxo-dGTP pyrophosphatase MutT (NUDIX family)
VTEARAAATVVVLRPRGDGLEVLLTRRPATMRFGGDLDVFPGGRLEPGEDHRAAAARETAEEVGIDLDPQALVPLTRWVTPAGAGPRYDTRFFGAIVGAATEARPFAPEVVAARWLMPRQALDAYVAREVALWPPTLVTLQQLDGVAGEADLRARFAPEAAGPIVAGPGPRVVEIAPGVRRLDGGWAAGVEGRRSTAWLVGRAEWIIVDPGDPTGAATEAALAAAAAAGARLAGVVVSDLEPDHHAGAGSYHVGLGLPVLGPPGARRLAPYDLVEVGDREVIEACDVPVRTRLEGPRSGRWGIERRLCLVGPGWTLPDPGRRGGQPVVGGPLPSG